jgi:hypothetical protein
MEPNTTVFLKGRCNCLEGALCSHRKPLVVLKQFKTNGKLLVDNGDHVLVVDADKVTARPSRGGGV